MTASFVCRTGSPLPVQQLFDLARSIDLHLDSQLHGPAGQGAVGVLGVAVERLFLAGYLKQLINARGRFLADCTENPL